jgi:hypothetical protein
VSLTETCFRHPAKASNVSLALSIPFTAAFHGILVACRSFDAAHVGFGTPCGFSLAIVAALLHFTATVQAFLIGVRGAAESEIDSVFMRFFHFVIAAFFTARSLLAAFVIGHAAGAYSRDRNSEK